MPASQEEFSPEPKNADTILILHSIQNCEKQISAIEAAQSMVFFHGSPRQFPILLCDPMDYIVHGIIQARILEWVGIPFSRESSQPRSPTLQADSLPAEPQVKSKNTGVYSLSLLQQIFPTQELNWGLLHCRWILYQLSYPRSLS